MVIHLGHSKGETGERLSVERVRGQVGGALDAIPQEAKVHGRVCNSSIVNTICF